MREPERDDVGRLLKRFYQCALESSGWSELLRDVSEFLDARVAHLWLHHDGAEQQHVTGIETPFDARFEDYLRERRNCLERLSSRMGGDRPAKDIQVEVRKLTGSPLFDDLFAPLDLHHSLEARASLDDRKIAVLTLLRPSTRDPFGQRERWICETVTPHAARAMTLTQRIERADADRGPAEDALDRLPYAMVILDEDGRTLFTNRMARELAGEGETILLDGDRVRAANRADDEELRAILAAVCRKDSQEDRAAMRFSWRSRGSRLVAVVSALPIPAMQGARATQPRAAAVLLLSDPDSPPVPASETLREFFDLTPAEAGVTRLLLDGQSLAEAAETLGVSIHTVRTHLKRVFAKTATTSQAELVRVLAGGVLSFQRDAER